MIRWHVARVRDTSDPDRALRLRLEIPTLYGDQPPEEWIRPFSASFVTVPPVDATVLVLESGAALRWVGMDAARTKAVPKAFAAPSAYGRRAGSFSPKGGALIVLEDRRTDAGDDRVVLVAGRTDIASSVDATTSEVMISPLADDYVFVRDVLIGFLDAIKAAPSAPAIAAAATAAIVALTAGTPKADRPASAYKARTARAE